MIAPRLKTPHHVFLQKLMVEHVLPESIARQLYRDVAQSEDAAFAKFVDDINDELSFLSMEIRIQTYQGDGKKYYGLVNKVADDQAKMGTKFQHGQIAHFKAILESIVTESKGAGAISTMDAINLRPDAQCNTQAPESSQAAAAHALSASEKERNIVELISEGWLERLPDGHVALAPRTFMELRTVIQSLDVPACRACTEPAVKAQACEAPDCPTWLHDHCAESWFNRPGEPRTCPEWGAEWPPAPQEETAADERVEDEAANGQRNKRARRERGRT